MNGKTDEEIAHERTKAAESVRKLVGECEVINSFFEGLDGSPLWMLGLSLQFMSMADVVYFAKGWESARGCRVEYQAALDYGLEVIEE